MTQRALRISATVSWMVVGHEPEVERLFAEEVRHLRALGIDPVEIPAEGIAVEVRS